MKLPARTRSVALTLAAGVGMSLLAVAAFVPEGRTPRRAPVEAAAAAQEMTQGALNFLARLTPEQKEKATFGFEDPQRPDWHFIPKKRKGLKLSELNPEQRHMAYAFLATGLSSRGFVKAITVMSLEQILFELEGPRSRFKRDPQLYHFCIFGAPGPEATWGWSVEGHHLSINYTIIKGKWIAAQPTFFGTNPDIVMDGPRKGTRALPVEQDLPRELLRSLNAEQRKLAIFSDKAPGDMLTKARPYVKRGDTPGGLPYSKLTGVQKALIRRLVEEYANRHRPEIAQQELAKIFRAGWDKVTFAWGGGLEPGQGHYYRVKGSTFLIEYANVQNKANHCHSVWRDYDGDFGADLLKIHYKKEHGK